MRKNWPLIILLMLFAIIGLFLFNLADEVEQGGGTTVKGNDTTINVDNALVGEAGDATTCIRIDAETYGFDALRAAGHTTDYQNNIWKIDGEPIGYAATEDSAFIACGPTELINTMEGFH